MTSHFLNHLWKTLKKKKKGNYCTIKKNLDMVTPELTGSGGERAANKPILPHISLHTVSELPSLLE